MLGAHNEQQEVNAHHQEEVNNRRYNSVLLPPWLKVSGLFHLWPQPASVTLVDSFLMLTDTNPCAIFQDPTVVPTCLPAWKLSLCSCLQSALIQLCSISSSACGRISVPSLVQYVYEYNNNGSEFLTVSVYIVYLVFCCVFGCCLLPAKIKAQKRQCLILCFHHSITDGCG